MIHRYTAQMILPEVQTRGQANLHAGTVAIVGCGGLGSTVALSLACQGVGHLRLIDPDRIEESNLPRQMVYDEADCGKLKCEILAQKLVQKNSNITLQLFPDFLSKQNALEILSDVSIIVDATDNYQSRLFLNEIGQQLKKPIAFACCEGWNGWASVFWPEGPCLKCLFPTLTRHAQSVACQESGVIGFMPALLGQWQAGLVVRLLLGLIKPPGQGWHFDGLNGCISTFSYEVGASCSWHGDLSSLEVTPLKQDNMMSSDEITVQEFKALQESGQPLAVLDVRNEREQKICSLGGILIPLPELPQRLSELDMDKEWIVYCRSGARSGEAVDLLLEEGFKAKNLKGGIVAWHYEIDDTFPVY